MYPSGHLRLALLNPWQRDFPLQRDPFARIGSELGLGVREVIDGYAALQGNGSLSRIGGIFAASAGGAAVLAAMSVPAERLRAVAAIVSAHPCVNHNYEREHTLNLWFVMTGHDAAAVEQSMCSLVQATGLPALRLRMERPYRIDLGFDLRHRTSRQAMAATRLATPIAEAELPLAALVEAGLPLIPRPFDAWAQSLRWTPEQTLATLQGWLDRGALKRFGAIVRHHELGFDANAMTVFDVPDALVDGCGEALAVEPGVTLAYRRERASGWPFNLYCMVHGRDRGAVHDVLERVIPSCALSGYPREVLFSRQRFKQTGARRFRGSPGAVAAPNGARHAVV